ncbi:dTMP kinase [Cloacibacillus sp.]|uniref:dTMP kinase n=1 Tax=Cloacibacillus sp. TaxID=2049023 RepID=UPI0025BC37CF|nr:dTMP kinase [Cloacibacillus sp.]MCC8057447.1 dTMP kinase [Cloacibacillus sp.]MCC8177659.1 dTMP kinase [Cloacibacillus sp.]
MFITFEGIDGCGKSTQARLLFELLNKEGGAVLTREPGGWEGGGTLHDIVLSGDLRHPWSELFLFMLDRTEHAARVISPAISEGRHVVCERYHDSTLAYQVWGRGMPFEPLWEMAKLAALPEPDVTLFFKIEPALALSRVGKRGKPDSFEREGLAFMERIDRGYRSLAEMEPRRWAVIECGDRNPAEIFAQVKDVLAERGLPL